MNQQNNFGGSPLRMFEVEEKLPIEKVNRPTIRSARGTKAVRPARKTKEIKAKKEIALLNHADPKLSAGLEREAETRAPPLQSRT